MSFVLAALRALHPDPGSGPAISGCRGERKKNGTHDHEPRAAQEGVDDFIRGVDDAAEFCGVVEEREELVPGAAPYVGHARVPAAPFGVEVLQRELGSL